MLVATLSGAHRKPPGVMLTRRLSAPNRDDVSGQHHHSHPHGSPAARRMVAYTKFLTVPHPVLQTRVVAPSSDERRPFGLG